MMVPYVLRLLCICLASFFLVNAVFGLMASVASRAAIRISEAMRPRAAAQFLFILRMLPLALGGAVVLGLCVPSYLWFEPQTVSERMGLACMALASLGAVSWSLSFARAARAIAASFWCNRVWRQTGRETRLLGDTSRAVVVEKDAPLLALSGVFRPRLIVSRAVLRELSSEELDVALQHENAHRVSRDNLKRLLLLLAPDSVPLFRACSSLEQTWARLSEWAADDEATLGDSHRALSLAAALLRVARMGAGPRLSFLHTSLVAGDRDLSARVDRLLRLEPARLTSPPWARFFTRSAALLTLVSIAGLIVWPATLSSVHRLLELFLR